MRNPLGLIVLLGAIHGLAGAETVKPAIAEGVTRPWAGPDWWTNPWEDWQLRQGRIENTMSGGDRKVVILTAELSERMAAFSLQARLHQLSFEMRGDGYAGWELGLQGEFQDYRDSAVYGSGIAAGIDARGCLFIGSPKSDGPPLPRPVRDVRLELTGEPADGAYRLTLRAVDAKDQILGELAAANVHPSWLTGLVALASSSCPPSLADPASPRPARTGQATRARGGEMRFAFDAVSLSGDKVSARPERAFGPILWTTYTRDNEGNMRLLLQAAPFAIDEEMEATLEVEGRETQFSRLDPISRTAVFRLRRLDPAETYAFTAKLAGGSWKGTLRPVPDGARPCVIASLSCNDATGFPHQDLVANVSAHQPDVLTFLGDQIYEGVGGYGAIFDQRPNDRAVLSYLRKYAMHGWIWRDLLRDLPSVTLPDDHDVFHGNLWGAGGKAADVSEGYGNTAQDSGGYKMSPEFVNMVHRTQTGNLPDPADASSAESPISMYFTRLSCGPFDFAIIADRQFKSAPAKVLPEAKIANGWPRNAKWDAVAAGSEGADLLGSRQEAFLDRWAQSPDSAVPFRIVLSQTPWLAPQTLPKDMSSDVGVPDLKVYRDGEYPPDDEAKADYDTNGWPQDKRTMALGFLRRAKALHITGDQHLGSTGRYGLKSHADGPWWVSTPATANIWPRRWMPAVEGKNRRPGDPKWLGAFTDGFGNKFTMHAVANPRDVDREPARLFDRAVGYTITTWDRAAGQVSIANWPYWASPAKPEPDAKPYLGWPIKVDLKSLDRVD